MPSFRIAGGRMRLRSWFTLTLECAVGRGVQRREKFARDAWEDAQSHIDHPPGNSLDKVGGAHLVWWAWIRHTPRRVMPNA